MFRIGERVRHITLGVSGEILSIDSSWSAPIARVRWDEGGISRISVGNLLLLEQKQETLQDPLRDAFEAGFSGGVVFSKGSDIREVENSDAYKSARDVGFDVFRRSLK